MKILLYTHVEPSVATARIWFYEMAELLLARGMEVSLNEFKHETYDLAIVHWGTAESIQKVLEHSPNCHVGVFNPGLFLGPGIAENIDFMIVLSVAWAELFLHIDRRMYRHFDFPSATPRVPKQHRNSDDPMVIGYIGGEHHFANDIEPHLTNALQRLAREFNILLRAVVPNAAKQKIIPGVPTDMIEWELDSHEKWTSTFDVGICPSYADLISHADPYTYIRNPNRISTLLFEAIPSVASPLFESCRYYQHEKHVFWAVTEEGWYAYLKKLIQDPALRQSMGDAGRLVAEEFFNRDRAAEAYQKIIEEEMTRPVFPKQPELLIPPPAPPPPAPPPAAGLLLKVRRRLAPIKKRLLG